MATFLIAGICFLCARSIQEERIASIGEVRDEFRELLKAYGMDPDDHDPTNSDQSRERMIGVSTEASKSAF